MIGRLARENTWADIGYWNVSKVAGAGLFIAAALTAQYGVAAPAAYVAALSAASLCFSGFPIIWGAVKGLIHLRTNVDELLALAIAASLVLGEWISAAIVAFIMVLGGLLEEYTSTRARRHIERLLEGSPAHARVLDDSGEVRTVPIGELRPGQRVLTRPGDVIPADGVVIEGASDVDESMLTGESVPVAKTAGSLVSAGTIACEGALQIRVERIGGDTLQGKIVQLITEAEQHRAPILRVAERYAQWFTPVILLAAAAIWLVTGDALRAVTMLIVGCPCSFVLATPTAVIAALGRASKCGILIKGGKYLEACAQTHTLAFDKTGTLTTGHYRLSEIVPLDGHAPETLLSHAARLEASAEHPVAQAIVQAAQAKGLSAAPGTHLRREAGLGVSELRGPEGSTAWRCGNQRFMERHQVDMTPEALAHAEALHAKGQTVLFLAEGGMLQGLLALEDEIRPGAQEVLRDLAQGGFDNLVVLTGDHETVAHRVADRLDIPRGQVFPHLLPKDKYEYVQALETAGKRVCYIGDGANDGPALAVASVGVSIGARENTVALETADIVLMRNGLEALPFLLRLSKATRRTIGQNIILFGLAYNALMLACSAAGLLTPILGAFGHNVGSIAVVLNSARLLKLRDSEQ